MSKRIELGFRLSDDLDKKIRHEAKLKGVTLTQVITERLEHSFRNTRVGTVTPEGFTRNWETKV